MRFFVLCIGLVTVFGPLPVIGEQRIPYFVKDEPYRPFLYHLFVQLTDCYQAVVIEHDAKDGVDPNSPRGRQIIRLAERGRATKELVHHATANEDFEGEYTPEEIRAMDDTDRIDDLHSSRILILECGKPLSQAKVIAGMQVIAEGSNGMGLELERIIPGYQFHRDWRILVPFHESYRELPDGTLGPMEYIPAKPMLEGGTIQLTGLFRTEANNKPEIVALLNFLASEVAMRRMQSMPDVVLTKEMRSAFREVTNRRMKIPDRMTLWPTKVVAYADKKLAEDYYIPLWKFRNANPNGGPTKGRLYVIEQSLDDYRRVNLNNFLLRKGDRLLHENGIQARVKGRTYHYDVQNQNALRRTRKGYLVGPAPNPVVDRLSPEFRLFGMFDRCADDVVHRVWKGREAEVGYFVRERLVNPWVEE